MSQQVTVPREGEQSVLQAVLTLSETIFINSQIFSKILSPTWNKPQLISHKKEN